MTRRGLAAGLAGLALPAGLFASPGWTRDAGLDVWNLPGLTRQCEAEVCRGDDLDAQTDDLHRRNVIKRGVLAELADGRLDLAAAAAEFLALDAADRWTLTALRVQFPDGPDLKRAARSVLVWAEARAVSAPDLLRRLEAEFRSLYPGG